MSGGLSRVRALLAHSLAKNHAFADGNKRVAFWAMGTFLRLNGDELRCDTDEGERTFLAVASGSLREDGLTAWIEAHAMPVVEPTPPAP